MYYFDCGLCSASSSGAVAFLAGNFGRQLRKFIQQLSLMGIGQAVNQLVEGRREHLICLILLT